jgi:Carboxypeptidase regulatory-like domain/TonB dependent receptor
MRQLAGYLRLASPRSAGMLLAVLVLLTGLSTQAQEFRATLSGRVADSSGAVVVKAAVTAVEVSSKTTYTAKTGNDGIYYIPYVLPGTYTVTVTAKGFKTAVQENVRMFAAQGFGQNFKLEVGAATEQVTVTDAPPELETTTGSGGNLIQERELQAVPLNGRQVFNLLGTTPGSQSYNGTRGPNNTGTRGSDNNNGYSIGGGAPQGDAGLGSSNQFTLNGVNITQQTTFQNQSSGAWNVAPDLDTVSEVNVMTTNYDARFGRTAGGTINVVSKSGANQFHGDVFENYGGALFDANTFQNNLLGLPRQGYVENQYDGTFGGPIKRNKLFFFFGFEGYNESISGGVSMNVPPAYLRPGYSGNPSSVSGVDFGLVPAMDPTHFGPSSGEPAGIPIYQPGTAVCPASDGGIAASCNNNNDLYQTPFPNDAIPTGQINSTALAILKYIPLPNIPSAANFAKGDNYYLPQPLLTHYYQPSVRVDYNLSDKTKLYSYYEWQTGEQYQSNNGLTGLAANGSINQKRENWAAGQDITHTFSSSLLLDAKVSFSRFVEIAPDGNFSLAQPASSLGLSMPLPGNTNVQDVPEISVGDNYTGGILGQTTSPTGDTTIFGNAVGSDATTNVSLDVDLTMIKGPHSMHIGGSVADFKYGDWSLSGHPNGDFSFNSAFTQYNPTNSGCFGSTPGSIKNKCNSNEGNGSALADFYLGYPSGGGIDWFGTNSEGEPVYAVYFQDDWRVTPKLTLNLGIRYDVQRGLRDRHNALDAGLCLTCVNPVTSDANFQANIANAGNIAAWQAAGVSAPTQVLGGQEFPGVGGNSRDAYYTDWSNIGPRVGFAYAVDKNTVVRGGWGIVYQGGLEGGSNGGFAETTPYNSSPNGNVTPNPAFQSGSPFAGVSLQVPQGSAQGLLTNIGNSGIAFDFPKRKLPLGEVFSLGFQRELPGRIVVDARYAGNYSYRNRTFVWLSAANTTLSDWNAAIANPSLFTAQVPNPYYNVAAAYQGGSGCGAYPTIWALDLLEPLGQYCSGGGPSLVGEYNKPIGRNWYNGLEVKVNRHIYGSSRGLFFQAAYTWSKTINGNGYPFGWPFQGAAAPVPGGVSTKQQHIIASTDRDQILSVTPVWDLPFGKGALLFSNPPAPVGIFINGWTLSSVIQIQSGQPVGLNNGWTDSCPLSQLRPSHSPGVGAWLRNDATTLSNCWHQIPNVDGYTWGLQSLPTQDSAVRQPSVADIDLSLQKTTPIREKINFILRLDAFNSFNSPQFGGPDNNPADGTPIYTPGSGWSGFGTIGPAQSNFPRILKVSGKITF